MPAGRYDMTCEQGTTFRQTLRWLDESDTPVDLTGYTAAMQVRASHKAATTWLDLSSTNGDIVIVPEDGELQITVVAIDTAALAPGTGVYDLELTSPGGIVTRLIEGKFTVTPEVTKV